MMIDRDLKENCRGLLVEISLLLFGGTKSFHDFRSWCRRLNPGLVSTKPQPSCFL